MDDARLYSLQLRPAALYSVQRRMTGDADELDQATVFGWPLLVHPEPGSSVFTALRQELSDAGQLLLARGPWDVCEGAGGATEAAEASELPTPQHVDLARQLVRDLQAGWQSETKAEGVAES
ncbi:hypothetical protein HaLaN_22330 [Haematococcus lacustris]|uniref:Uncharacterized protein n=1 Tax=Haematococcus lacustris TaxID=44745 RepID=A0A699ZQE7_HAELA|nr:hypothetical protein HaLaN_22330 [Haematococcus lacustris]